LWEENGSRLYPSRRLVAKPDTSDLRDHWRVFRIVRDFRRGVPESRWPQE
jgi:hypothetical protein